MAKILLVEDDNNLREIFEMRLQAEGYQTVTASNGEDALVTAMKEKPDLIVADVMMPKLSGFEMLETLRAAPETKNAKVVMMTALGQAEDQARGEKLGVIKYLVKSQVTLEDFTREIRGILQPDKSTLNGSDSGKANQSSTNNKQESEKSMPEDTTPTNPVVPDSGSNDDAGANPISSPSPGMAGGSDGQMSSAQQQDVVKDQTDDFVSSTPATPPADAGSSPTADSGSSNDFGGSPAAPVTPPPADAPGGDDSSGSNDQTTPTPPSGL